MRSYQPTFSFALKCQESPDWDISQSQSHAKTIAKNLPIGTFLSLTVSPSLPTEEGEVIGYMCSRSLNNFQFDQLMPFNGLCAWF